MRKSAIVFYTVLACVLIGVTLFPSLRAQAIPPADPSGLNSAIHGANGTEQAHYVRRRGRWHYASRHQNLRYHRPYTNAGEPPYNPYYWASPAKN